MNIPRTLRQVDANLKRSGNQNRIIEMHQRNLSANEIQQCFQSEGIRLVIVAGDFPLIANFDELGRKALPRRVAAQFQPNADPIDAAAISALPLQPAVK